MKVLVAEDDSASRLLLQELLKPYGEVHTAINGRDAIATFHLAMTQGEPYDLVCLDIVMPGMDGHEVLTAIRNMEAGQAYTRIIMTTALADPDSVERAILECCDAYIVKPITREVLRSRLVSLGLAELKALVVGADSAIRLLLKQFLEPYGKVHMATSGRAAINVFRLSMVHKEPFDLVCLDVAISDMNGYEVLMGMRQLEDDQIRTKIIMTVSFADLRTIEESAKELCDAYIVKPVTREALTEQLRSIKLL